MRNWLKRILAWLREGSLGWLTILAPLSIWIVLGFLCPGLQIEVRIRYFGMIFELLGLVIVAVGLQQTSNLFGRPNMLIVSGGWIKRFPKFRKTTANISGAEKMKINADVAHGYGHVSNPKSASVEERLEFLEQRARKSAERENELEQQIRKESSALRKDLSEEKRARNEADSKIQRLVEDAAAGDIHLEAVGVIWLFMGIVAATASSELQWLIQ